MHTRPCRGSVCVCVCVCVRERELRVYPNHCPVLPLPSLPLSIALLPRVVSACALSLALSGPRCDHRPTCNGSAATKTYLVLVSWSVLRHPSSRAASRILAAAAANRSGVVGDRVNLGRRHAKLLCQPMEKLARPVRVLHVAFLWRVPLHYVFEYPHYRCSVFARCLRYWGVVDDPKVPPRACEKQSFGPHFANVHAGPKDKVTRATHVGVL